MTMGQPGPGGQDPSTETSSTPPPAPSWQPGPGSSTPGSGAPAWTANLTSTAPVAGPAGYVYGDVPNRIIAYIIDAIIIGIIGFVVSLILQGILGPTQTVRLTGSDPNNPFGIAVETNYVSALVIALVQAAISAGYFIFTWTNPGMRGSVGMKVLGMQVGNETDGATVTTNQALTRWVLLGAPLGIASVLAGVGTLGLLIALAALVWFIVLLVTTAQSPTKQGMHDRYAKTVVVKAARSVS